MKTDSGMDRQKSEQKYGQFYEVTQTDRQTVV